MAWVKAWSPAMVGRLRDMKCFSLYIRRLHLGLHIHRHDARLAAIRLLHQVQHLDL